MVDKRLEEKDFQAPVRDKHPGAQKNEGLFDKIHFEDELGLGSAPHALYSKDRKAWSEVLQDEEERRKRVVDRLYNGDSLRRKRPAEYSAKAIYARFKGEPTETTGSTSEPDSDRKLESILNPNELDKQRQQLAKEKAKLAKEQALIEAAKKYQAPKLPIQKPIFLAGRYFQSTTDGYFCLDSLFEGYRSKVSRTYRPVIWVNSNSARILNTYYYGQLFIKGGRVFGSKPLFIMYALFLDPTNVRYLEPISDNA